MQKYSFDLQFSFGALMCVSLYELTSDENTLMQPVTHVLSLVAGSHKAVRHFSANVLADLNVELILLPRFLCDVLFSLCQMCVVAGKTMHKKL